VIATHTRLVAASGFATGLGGPLTMPVTIPTDVAVFYAMSARCVAATAHLRGYDTASDEVRSVVLLTLLGAGGAGLAAEFGATLGTKAAMAALKKLPGRTLIEINKKVGFRLFTKFGTKGVVNLGRWIPVVGGGVGAGINVAAMRTAGRYAKSNFPAS
jgi:EcsC family protein